MKVQLLVGNKARLCLACTAVAVLTMTGKVFCYDDVFDGQKRVLGLGSVTSAEEKSERVCALKVPFIVPAFCYFI